MFLLDTNTLIYFFKGQGNVAERLFAVPPGDVAISSVSLYEIEVGIAKSAGWRRVLTLGLCDPAGTAR
jgi:tRNA(fMet)-specific endonuclease VapC